MLHIRIAGTINAVVLGVVRPEADKHVAHLVGNHIAYMMRLTHWSEVSSAPSRTAVKGEMQVFVAERANTPNQQGVIGNSEYALHQTCREIRGGLPSITIIIGIINLGA